MLYGMHISEKHLSKTLIALLSYITHNLIKFSSMNANNGRKIQNVSIISVIMI